ncbi:cation diffusion facilitator family transporter [Patescibacteria group bacterium]|nr:cation diffusion facilitator family transporter [Patescibacteria group bacterium]
MQRGYKKNLAFGAKVALGGIIHLALLATLKAVFGYVTGIVVLTADALASLADFLSLFAAYLGLRISGRRATKNFAYGYYKAETLAALIAALLILYFGIRILFESINRITNPAVSQYQILAVVSVVVSILLSLRLASHLQKAGEKINSLALINNAKDKKVDVLVQVAVLIGVGANFFHIPYLEGIVGVIISFLTLKMGLETAKESLFFLLDYFDDSKLIKKIRKIIVQKSKILREIKEIRMRRAGTFIFGEAFLEVNPYAQTKDIRNELNNLKAEIMKTSPYLKDFLILVDVPYRRKIKIAVPVTGDDGLKSGIATSFNDTKAVIFVEVMDRKIINHYAKKFDFKFTDIDGIRDFLISEGINVIVNNDMHSLLFYELRRLNNIDVYPNFGNVTNVENAVKLLVIDT